MNMPIVIIGLGGIGSEIVHNVERQMRQYGAVNKNIMDKASNVRFVIIDTDVNSIREIEQSGYQGYSVCLSDNVSVSSCLESDKEEVEKWFPDNKKYYRKSLAEGAGQVRSISRLALQRAIRTKRLKPLYDALDDLHKLKERQNEQEIKIAIVSTVAGGTGSGAVLPLGIHIQDYLNRNYSAENAKINAFLILPDILHNVIRSNEERRNLDANGYATIKEIDAFMRDDIPRASITLPNETNDTVKEFWDSPFDFCFLFSYLSNNRGKLGDENNEDYKNEICKCLYTQYLGTFSKEYFCREDNVYSSHIREIEAGKFCYEQFAGAGSSVLRYPLEEIREYLSLCWMSDIIEKEWIQYDKKRKEIWDNSQDEKSLRTMLTSEGELYLEAVEEVDEGKELTCRKRMEEIGNRIQGNLLDKIRDYIGDCLEQKYVNLNIHIAEWPNILKRNLIKNRKELIKYLNDYEALKLYLEKENQQLYAMLSAYISRQICSLHYDDAKDYYLESFLKDMNGEFESPDYIRFFLYSMEKDIRQRKEELIKDVQTKEEVIEDEQKIMEQVTVDRLRKGGVKAWTQKRQTVYLDMKELLKKRLEYHCITQLEKYIKQISESYERFFGEYSRMLSLIRRHKRELENKFGCTKLKLETWVYADHERLQKMYMEMIHKKQYYLAEKKISRWLFEERVENSIVQDNSDMVDKYEIIKEKWEKEFDSCFLKLFNMNVLQALKREAEEEEGKTGSSAEKIMKEKLERVRDNAAARISSCRKSDKPVRKYCVFPSEILNEKDCDAIINEFFNTKTAFEDKKELDVNERQIVFVEIVYGYLPEDIDFMGSEPGQKADYPEGTGTPAYNDIVKRFCNSKSNVRLTPHIDRRWHKICLSDKKKYPMLLSSKAEVVLLILYMYLLMDDISSKNVLPQDETGVKNWAKNQFTDHYEKDGQDDVDIMKSLIKKGQAELQNFWKEQPAQKKAEAKRQMEKVRWVQDALLKEWYGNEPASYQNRLSIYLSENFLDFLQKELGVGLEWINLYEDVWRNLP